MWEAVFVKLAGLGVAAKAGVASAAVVAATTGAGAAGALPVPAQHAVADAVRTVTPFELPPAAQGSADFGQAVSRDARDPEAPGVDGPSVANTASNGRSRAGQQNAEDAGRAEDAGSPGSRGLNRAGDNPVAADKLPSQVPAGRQTGRQHRQQRASTDPVYANGDILLPARGDPRG